MASILTGHAVVCLGTTQPTQLHGAPRSRFIISISFLSLLVFKLFSTHALSSVQSQQLPHCENKNTQHDQTVPANIQQLRTAIEEEWTNIPQSTT